MFGFHYQNIDDYKESREYATSLHLNYHYPLDEKSSIYYGGGFGLSNIKTTYNSGGTQKDDGITLIGELGWEFFITPHAGINIGFMIERTEYDVDGYVYEDEEVVTFTSEIGLTLYF